MPLGDVALSLLSPPLCAACGRARRLPEGILCVPCARRLAASEPFATRGPDGLDRVWSSAAHDGVARQLVVALKFRRLLPVAGAIAERVADLAPLTLLSGTLVPVPTSRLRLAGRGFDPAGEIAAALGSRLDLPVSRCLVRAGGSRQVGRRRAQRVGNPPRVSSPAGVPRSVVLVDDVLTTGATLSACAQALRGAGASRVVGVTFARRL